MGFWVFLLVAAVCLQGSAVLSQQQQPQQPYGFESQAMWNPNVWAPYVAAASNFWLDYAKKAHEATHQLHHQWDKTGAGNAMFAVGMSYAEQAAKEAEKFAAAAAQQAQKQAGQAPYF